jgi:hypothetical protein
MLRDQEYIDVGKGQDHLNHDELEFQVSGEGHQDRS